MSGFTDCMDRCRDCGMLREYRQLRNNVCINRSTCYIDKTARQVNKSDRSWVKKLAEEITAEND